ncbi:MAG: GrpB family protein [Acidimicrobiales bacterium]
MLIFRFDPEVSIPVSEFGSRFRIGPLVAPRGSGRVQVLHLGPNGLIGRHEAASRQLVAAVAGSGWVSGDDRKRRRLTTGYAALWDRGESHEAGTESGLTLVCVEGEFKVEAHTVTADIVVVDHDPAWFDWFARVRDHVWPAVRHIAIRIDHVGSTSVPDLPAKPAIDMDIVVPSESEVRPVVESLARIGYRWQGDLGVEGRQAFAMPEDLDLPLHHLYLVVENNKAHIDHWLLGDILRSEPEAGAATAISSGATSRSPEVTWTCTWPPRLGSLPNCSPKDAESAACRRRSTGSPSSMLATLPDRCPRWGREAPS